MKVKEIQFRSKKWRLIIENKEYGRYFKIKEGLIMLSNNDNRLFN